MGLSGFSRLFIVFGVLGLYGFFWGLFILWVIVFNYCLENWISWCFYGSLWMISFDFVFWWVGWFYFAVIGQLKICLICKIIDLNHDWWGFLVLDFFCFSFRFSEKLLLLMFFFNNSCRRLFGLWEFLNFIQGLIFLGIFIVIRSEFLNFSFRFSE